jgi:hypothetical protein
MRAKPFSERTSFCLLMILSLTASWSLVGRRGQEREAEGGELLELLNGEIFPFQDALVDNSVLLQLHVLKLQSPDLILQLHQLSAVLAGDLVGELSPATHESESQRERGRVTKEEEGKENSPEGLRILFIIPEPLLDVFLHRIVLRNGFAKLITLRERFLCSGQQRGGGEGGRTDFDLRSSMSQDLCG